MGPQACAGPVAAQLRTLEAPPKWLNLVPIVAQWLWLSIKYRSVTLPSCANPAIPAGALVGEGKMEYFASMGAVARRVTAATTSIVCADVRTMPAIRDAMRAANLDFPVIAKPGMGWCGFGVRLIQDDAQLSRYLTEFPRGARIVPQAYLADEGEAGIFYLREPSANKGYVLGMLLRQYPQVRGDGGSTTARLMARNPRLARIGRDGACEAACDPSRVPSSGERVRLSAVSSSRDGALSLDGNWAITSELTSAIDAVALDMRGFQVGRFDVKFSDLDALRRGTSLKLIEVNGAGSEAVHAWGPAHSLAQADAIIFDKQRRMFELASRMRALGHRPIGLARLARLHLSAAGAHPPLSFVQLSSREVFNFEYGFNTARRERAANGRDDSI